MRSNLSLVLRLMSVVGFLFVGAVSVIAQDKIELSPEKPTAEVRQFGWSANGELVLEIVIHSPTAKGFALGRLSEKEGEDTEIFTTKDSHLVDLRTQQEIPSLLRIPSSPNFGRIKAATDLAPGTKLTFTGAYGRPVDPPEKKPGTREDYQLRLQLPLGIPPIEFKIPYGGGSGQAVPIAPAN